MGPAHRKVTGDPKDRVRANLMVCALSSPPPAMCEGTVQLFLKRFFSTDFQRMNYFHDFPPVSESTAFISSFSVIFLFPPPKHRLFPQSSLLHIFHSSTPAWMTNLLPWLWSQRTFLLKDCTWSSQVCLVVVSSNHNLFPLFHSKTLFKRSWALITFISSSMLIRVHPYPRCSMLFKLN